jgi:uncharacterized repeat protein (TIGR01451 family)
MRSLLINRKQTASFMIVSLMLAITALWLLLAAATSSNAQTSTAPSPADWTQFHRDNMQRWNPYETTIGVGNAGSLQLKWKVPNGAFFALTSSPAVVNGVVYVGSDDNNVYALDANTGAKLWSYATGDRVDSSPVVTNGVVYVGSSDHNVYALNANTGALLWRHSTGGGEVRSSPAVANGVVYVGAFENYTLYALNASTGALLWSYDTGGAVFGSPAVANGVVYIGSDGGNVYALNAGTGAKLWSFATGGPVASSPAVANGVVYIGSSDGKVYALNTGTGARLWSFDTGTATAGGVFSSPAVANGVVYIGDLNGNVYALNAGTGARLWSSNMGIPVDSGPAVANGVVYVSAEDNSILMSGSALFALNASTGARLWSYPTSSLSSSPAIVDGVVYVRAGFVRREDEVTTGSNLYAFSLGADLLLRIWPSTTTVHQGDLITYAFPVWNLGPANADHEVLNTQVPAGTTFDYIRISGTPGLGTCTHPPYQGTGQIVCHENASMAPNTTWTVRLTVKVTAPPGTVITESAATMADTPDPNLANNTATVSTTVQ